MWQWPREFTGLSYYNLCHTKTAGLIEQWHDLLKTQAEHQPGGNTLHAWAKTPQKFHVLWMSNIWCCFLHSQDSQVQESKEETEVTSLIGPQAEIFILLLSQCCVSFWCTEKWFRYKYTHTHTHTHILFCYGLLWFIFIMDADYTSFCYPAGPCCLSILCKVVCIC